MIAETERTPRPVAGRAPGGEGDGAGRRGPRRRDRPGCRSRAVVTGPARPGPRCHTGAYSPSPAGATSARGAAPGRPSTAQAVSVIAWADSPYRPNSQGPVRGPFGADGLQRRAVQAAGPSLGLGEQAELGRGGEQADHVVAGRADEAVPAGPHDREERGHLLRAGQRLPQQSEALRGHHLDRTQPDARGQRGRVVHDPVRAGSDRRPQSFAGDMHPFLCARAHQVNGRRANPAAGCLARPQRRPSDYLPRQRRLSPRRRAPSPGPAASAGGEAGTGELF